MRDPEATPRQSPPADPVSSAQLPVPGSRAAAMQAAATALRAAAADIEDPRTSCINLRAGASSRQALEVATWLRRRASIIEPEPVSAWHRNKLQVVELQHPELPHAVRTAAVEVAEAVASTLARYDLQLPPAWIDQLAGELGARAQVPA